MARVLIATQAWGVVQNRSGDVQGSVTMTLDDLDGNPADVFTTETGSTVQTSLSTNSRGEFPGWVDAGSYDQTVTGITRRVEATSGSVADARGETRAGTPTVQPAGQMLQLARFIPEAVHLFEEPDLLFAPAMRDERELYALNGTTHTNKQNTYSPSVVRAEVESFPEGLGVTAKQPQGIAVFPLDGLLAMDEWTMKWLIRPNGADLRAVTNASPICSAKVGVQYLRVRTATTQIEITLASEDDNLTDAGSTRAFFFGLPISTGDVPDGTWGVLTIVKDGDDMRAILDNNVRTASATSAGVIVRGWDGDVHASSEALGLAIGGNDTTIGADNPLTVIGPFIHRYARTYDKRDQPAAPKITVDADTAQGAFPEHLAGVVGFHTGFSETASETTYATVRDIQHDAIEAAGCKLIRLAEFDVMAPPTDLDPMTIDFTDMDTIFNRSFERGMDVHMHLGYTPTLLQPVSGDRYDPPTDNAKFAEYCSAVVTHAKALATAAGREIVSVSVWNEPSLFSSMTHTEYLALWQACAEQFVTDHPDLPAGGPDGMWAIRDKPNLTTETALQIKVMDLAEAEGLPLGHISLHDYEGSLTVTVERLEDVRACLDARGFTDTPIRLTEWNYSLGYGQDAAASYAFASRHHRHLTAHNAAFAYAFLQAALENGVDATTFFRLGQMESFWDGGSDDSLLGMFGRDGRPWPVFAAFALIWKHAGNRVASTTNWPGVRSIATKDTDGRIMLTYGVLRPANPRPHEGVTALRLEWDGLPASFTWTQWRMDSEAAGDGRPMVVAKGTEADLPQAVNAAHLSVGGIEIVPA